jgi:hypothetical protein
MANNRTGEVRILGMKSLNSTSSSSTTLYTFYFPDTHIEFKISSVSSEKTNGCSVKIFGVSRETTALFDYDKIKSFGLLQNVEILTGVNGVNRLIYTGTINKVRYKFNNRNPYMELILDQNLKKFSIQEINEVFKGEIKATEAVRRICDLAGFKFDSSNLNVFEDFIVSNLTVKGTFEECLRQIIGSKLNFYLLDDTIKLYGSDKKGRVEFFLNFDNGLQLYPEQEDDETYSIQSKLLPGIESGSVIRIPIDKYGRVTDFSSEYYLNLVVDKYEHFFNEMTDATKLECNLL